MSNLQILSTSIRTFENLYSLNDLHRASGNDPKHRPSLFARNEQTKLLVAEIENERSTKTIFALKTIRGGTDIEKQGTWGCKEIVIAYAAWISPQFHLVVLRAFLNQLENSQKNSEIQPLALPEKPRKIQGTTRAAEGEYLYTREFSALEIDQLADLWDVAEQQYNFILSLIPLFESMQSEHWLKKLSIAKSAFETPHMSYPVLAGICEDIEEYTGMSPSIRLKKRMERRFNRF